MKKKKKTKIKLILLIFLIFIGIVLFLLRDEDLKLKKITIELGETISKDINYYLLINIKKNKIDSYKLDVSNVLLEDNKTIKTGEYEYKIIYKDKEYINKIIVKDTIKPELILNNVIVTEGEEVNIDMFINICNDINGCKYKYKDEEYINSIINKVGKYDVEIIGYDDSNNQVINKTTLEIIEKPISEKVYTTGAGGTGKGIPVLNYHFTINNDEVSICSPSSICMKEELFESHIKYIKENNIKALTMKEFEEYIDGKIELDDKSVLITIDDGWFVSRAITILEKYDVTATLFLIGSLADPSAYASKNLEIHSHGWDLHDPGMCSIGRGGGILCYDKKTLLDDLKKSRESLNNTKAFCYPFYEYNDFAINALKQAGFTMAFTGGNSHAKRGMDKFKLPRYVMYNTTSVSQLASILNK